MYHTQSKQILQFVVKTGISHIVKRLKISLRLRYRAVPIHDVATREKHLLGSELAFVNFT